MTNKAPAGWPALDPQIVSAAKSMTMEALASAPLERYYDVHGGYAGATFASIEPNDPHDVTGADLHALSMLAVTVGPAATRRVIDDGPLRAALLDALHAVDPSTRMADATAADLEAAWNLYGVAKAALADPTTASPSDPWVTAAKLVARKRPRLLPVRDSKVRSLLGLEDRRDGRLEIQAIRALIVDVDVAAAIDDAAHAAETRAQAEGRHCAFDTEPLRLLDAALWMYAVRPAAEPV